MLNFNEKVYYTFDLDGTLLDDKQQLKAGVVEMFAQLKKNTPDAVFTIASGARQDQVQEAVNNINAALDEKIDFQIIANGGSYMNGENGVKIFSLTPHECGKIVETVRKYDKNAMIIFRTYCSDITYKPINFIQEETWPVIKKLASKYGLIPIEISPEDINKFVQSNGVLSVEVASAKSGLYRLMEEDLKNELSDSNLHMSCGAALEISKFGKKNAITYSLGQESLSNMAYFGDGSNDIEMFKAAKESFGIGKKVKVVKQAKYAVESYKQITDYLFNGYDLKTASQERVEFLKKNVVEKIIHKSVLKFSCKKFKLLVVKGHSAENEK